MNELIHVEGRVIIQVWRDQKNHHTFSDGTTIRLERDIENLDVKYTKISQGIVVSCDYIKPGSKILFHPNSAHPVNEILNHRKLSGEEIAADVGFYSISRDECFLYKEPDGSEWIPLKGFTKGLHVFRPYEGIIEGVPPTIIKNILYITYGELKGLAVQTVRAADYTLIFQGENGQEERIIRCRHYEDEDNDREEVIAIRDDLTELINTQKLLIGLSDADAKTLNQY